MNLMTFRRRMLMAASVRKVKMFAKLTQSWVTKGSVKNATGISIYTGRYVIFSGAKSHLSVADLRAARGKAQINSNAKASAMHGIFHEMYGKAQFNHIIKASVKSVTGQTGYGKLVNTIEGIGVVSAEQGIKNYAILTINNSQKSHINVSSAPQKIYASLNINASPKATLHIALPLLFGATSISSIGKGYLIKTSGKQLYSIESIYSQLKASLKKSEYHLQAKLEIPTQFKVNLGLSDNSGYGKVAISTSLKGYLTRIRRTKLADWLQMPLSDLIGVSLEEASWTKLQ